MTMTLVDLYARLEKLEETYLVELLDLTSDKIVAAFGEYIEDNYDRLTAELEEGLDVRASGEEEKEAGE